jgi:CHASE2 domain-containing sensor protein
MNLLDTVFDNQTITYYVRFFNTFICIGTIVYILTTLKVHKTYLHNNIAYIIALAYVTIVFFESALHQHAVEPLISAIGATVNILVIIIAVTSQSEKL